jgi:hypothetical protein
VQIPGRVLSPETDIRISSQMKHYIAASDGFSQDACVQQVALQKFESLIPASIVKECKPAGRKIVESGDLMAMRKQAVCEIAADKARASRYKAPQSNLQAVFDENERFHSSIAAVSERLSNASYKIKAGVKTTISCRLQARVSKA